MAACLAPDNRSEQPAHPNRGFGGPEQLAANWSQLFAAVSDLTAEVIAHTMDGLTTWTEWDSIAWGRFSMEVVEQHGAAIDETVQQLSRPRR